MKIAYQRQGSAPPVLLVMASAAEQLDALLEAFL
jgi:hypothetical protein